MSLVCTSTSISIVTLFCRYIHCPHAPPAPFTFSRTLLYRIWFSCPSSLWLFYISRSIFLYFSHSCPLFFLRSSYSFSLFSIGADILAPLFSTPIFLLHYDLPHFSSLSFTPIHSNLILSFPSVISEPLYLICVRSSKIWSLCSYSSLIDFIWNAW